MELTKIFITALSAVFLLSCNDIDNETIINEKTVELSQNTEKETFREAGQIPSEINFFSKILSVGDNEFELVSLLRDFKREYGSTDFYNNMFELASSELFKNENFKNLRADELSFVLNEMRNLESNMLNIKNIPVILESSLKAGIITKAEFNSITDELVSKNKNEIEKIKWSNDDIRNEKLSELEKVVTTLYHPLYRY